MTGWSAANPTNCKNNPVNISWPLPGSTNCEPLGIRALNMQNYTTHAQGASAFDQQLRQDNYTHLIAALSYGHPYDLADADAKNVVADLIRWGSPEFSNAYAQQTYASTGTGIKAPKLHGGWADLRHSFNHVMPASIQASEKQTNAALRTLQKARRVKL